MKGKSLFKKIGAIATTAAMLASVGVTGFAATEGVTYSGSAAVIMGVETVDGDGNGTGIYKVDVPYTSDVTNTIGVTMLSYSNDGNKSFTSTGTGTEFNDDTMQIVGVDQINAGSGDISTGTFTFYVDTTGETADETTAIRMDKGERGIVLLSGDAADGANGYLFQVGKADATVEVWVSTSATQTADAPGYPASGQTGADYIKGLLTSDWAVKLGGNTVTEGIEVTAATDYDASSWKNQKITYTVDVESDEYNVTATTLQVEYLTKSWTAETTVNYPSAIYADPNEQTDMDAVTAYVKEELADKTVALTDGTYTYNYALTAADINTINTPEGAVWAQDSSYNYTMTITGKTISADEVTIPTVTVTIPVTIQADTRYEATSAKAFKGSAEVDDEATYTMAENDTAQKVLDYVKTLADSYKVYDADSHEVAGTATWALYKSDAEATLTEALVDGAVYVAKATVAPAEAEGTDAWKDTAVVDGIVITITVSAAPPFVFGDVNDDGGIDYTDCGELVAYIVMNGDYTFNSARGNGVVDPKFGDVTADFKTGPVNIDYTDCGEVVAYIVMNGDYEFAANK